MSAHTKGPWSRNIRPARKYAVVFAGRNTHVAVVCSSGLTDEEIEANCDLITAAPDLLKALKQVVALSDRKTYVWDKAHAAIARAEGRTP